MPDELVPELKPKIESPVPGASTETLPVPEAAMEKPPTPGAEEPPKTEPALPELLVESTPAQQVPEVVPAEQKSPERLQIEEILSKDLGPLFEGLPAERQTEFKVAGETLAAEIEQMINPK